MADLAVSTDVAAPAEKVWGLISDVTRMGEWSPETTSCRWLGDAREARPGARFRGQNRNGIFRWFTTSTVVTADPGREFTFDVSFLGLPVATWSYRFEEVGPERCTVTEEWTDNRNTFMDVAGRFGTGVSDRKEHNGQTMRATLAALKAAVERA